MLPRGYPILKEDFVWGVMMKDPEKGRVAWIVQVSPV